MLSMALTFFAIACQPGAGGNLLGLPTWYKYLNSDITAGKCSVIFNFPEDMGKIALAIVEILLRLGGMVAVVFVIYGGVRYIISQGEPEGIAKAKGTIVNALIGLAITIIAVGLVNMIARVLA